MRASVLAATLIIATSGFALAQDQQVIPPRTVYWTSASTLSGMMGMSGGGMDMLRAMQSGGTPSSTRLELEIASQDSPARGAVEATHTVPPAARTGPDLRLTGRERAYGSAQGSNTPNQRPRGRLLLFYGCGEHAGRGQPIVLDFARLAEGQLPAGLESRVAAARTPNPPGSRGWPSVAYGPEQRRGSQQVTIPAGGSIVGEHVIRSTMAPEIRFSLDAEHDLLAPISFTRNAPNPSGSVALEWNAVPRSTAFALAAMGQGQQEGEMVYWTSSAVQTWDASLMEFVPPSEAARLVRERVLLSPTTTQCTVPAEAAQALGVGATNQERRPMLFITAFGPEANFVDPPRPSDPRTPWRQVWAAKVRINSAAMDGLGQSMMAGMMADGAGSAGSLSRDPLTETAPPEGMSQQQWCQERAEARRQRAASGSVGGAIGNATGIPGGGIVGNAIGGMFGANRNRDPLCT